MKTKHLFIPVLFIAFQTAYGQVQTEIEEQAHEHILFLEDFYTEYISNWNNLGNRYILEKYCTESLLKKISESKIDYNPFVKAQDIPEIILNHLKIEKYEAGKNLYIVSYPHDFHVEVEIKKIILGVINSSDSLGCKINEVDGVRGD